jgi:hypothetical protein
MKSTLPIALCAILTLLFHGMWEHAHIVLYTGYGAMEGVLPVWLLATLGDLVYTLVIILIISAAKRGFGWIGNATTTDLFAAAVLGFLVALMVEYKGLYLGRWEYLLSMPIVPFLGVGLSPLLQMTLLTPLSLFLTRLITHR